jgi:hypothetical protein
MTKAFATAQPDPARAAQPESLDCKKLQNPTDSD